MDWKNLFFSAEGRIGRQAFWIGWLCLLGANVVAGWVPFFGWALSLASIWCSICIHTKRLHDMGQSGWLVALPWVVSIVGIFVAIGMIGFAAIGNVAALEREDPAAILALIAPVLGLFGLLTLVNLGFLLWIGLADSQRGENRFGPNPKGY